MAVGICSGAWRPEITPARRRRWIPPSHRRTMVVAGTQSRGKRMFVFGVGFVGRYISDQLIRDGWQVSGTCTSAVKKRELVQMGLDAFIFEAKKNELRNLPTLQHATHLLISIPPIAGIGDPLLCYLEDLQSILKRGDLQWLCYLSTTTDALNRIEWQRKIHKVAGSKEMGANPFSDLREQLVYSFDMAGVYGDCGGAWVDEDYPVNPKTDFAKSRVAAEKGWLEIGQHLGVAANVFRLGGIYGPGRSALDTIIKQKTMSREQKMRESRLYTARVHVADIYEAIKASFGVPYSGLYNVVDDDPSPRAEVFAFARDLIQRRWADTTIKLHSDLSVDLEIQKGKVRGEKRVSNARLKKELGLKLLHPTYRSGLQSILETWKTHPDQS